MPDFEVTAPLWRYQGEAAWYFVTLPHDVADEIAHRAEVAGEPGPGGFGSVRVEVRCGKTTWRTSLFPDRASESYVLPIKRAVRRSEALEDGGDVRFRLRPVDG